MTEDEKKKMLDGFRKPEQVEEVEPWTEEEILETAKKIMKRLGIEGDLNDHTGAKKQ